MAQEQQKPPPDKEATFTAIALVLGPPPPRLGRLDIRDEEYVGKFVTILRDIQNLSETQYPTPLLVNWWCDYIDWQEGLLSCAHQG